MNLNLGEKIRELRRRDGRKQEDLAIALGVTPQAISRWESGGGYPDMEMIPSIANYFHVTIDWLFGYNDAREVKINDVLRRTGDMIAAGGDLTECIEILRDAVREFPSEPMLLLNLGLALSAESLRTVRTKKSKMAVFTSYDTEHNAQNPVAREAVSVLERVLTMDIRADDRKQVVLALAIHYASMGMYDRARELALKQSPIDVSREFVLAYATAGEERAYHNGNLALYLMRLLKLTFLWGVFTDMEARSSDYGEELLDALIALYRAIVPDGLHGAEHGDLSDLYACSAIIAARQGDMVRVERNLDLAISHRAAYDAVRNEPHVSYTAPLLASLSYDGRCLPTNVLVPLSTLCRSIPEEIQKELKKNEKYRAIFAE